MVMEADGLLSSHIRIVDAQNPGIVYAQLGQDGLGSSLMRLGADTYHLTVEPGVDVAFMTALVLMWDYREEHQRLKKKHGYGRHHGNHGGGLFGLNL